MPDYVADVCASLRVLRKQRGLSLVVIATLALGIAGNVAIFSFVYGVLLQPLPYAEPHLIVRLNETHEGHAQWTSTLTYLDWRNDNAVFDRMAASAGEVVTLTGVAEPVQLRCNNVSASHFEIFGLRAARGRTFLPGEDEPGQPRVVVISDALWRVQFAADPDILGRTLALDGQPHTVVGVMPGGTAIDRSYHQIWRPLVFPPENLTRNYHWLVVAARLKAGVTIEQARANMNTVAARIAVAHPETNNGCGVAVAPFAEHVASEDLQRSLQLLMAAVAVVLLLVCVNVAGVCLTRGLARQREVAIRFALGASRARIVRQFATDGALLCLAGTAAGLALGYVGIRIFNALLPANTLPAEAEIAINGPVLLFTVGVTAVTTLVCAVFPALQTARVELGDAFLRSAKVSTGRAQLRLQAGFVVGQVALAVALLAAAGLLIRSLHQFSRVPLGVDETNLLTARLPIAAQRFPTPESFTRYLEQITEQVRALPGVTDVSFTITLPLQRGGFGEGVQIAGDSVAENRPFAFFKPVAPSYFHTMRMQLQKGRDLNARDVRGSPPVAVVNEAFARRHFPDRDPLGHRVLIPAVLFGQMGHGADVAWEIVGVVSNERVGGLGNREWEPMVYASHEQAPQMLSQILIVRGQAGVTRLAREVSTVVHRINPDQVLTHVQTLEEQKSDSLSPWRLQSILLTAFAALALLVTAVGIFGTFADVVERRTRELGIRAALGATGRQLMQEVFSRASALVAIGLVLGGGLSLAAARLVSAFLFEPQFADPLVCAGAVLLLSAVAGAACLIPARRAARADPVVCLRAE